MKKLIKVHILILTLSILFYACDEEPILYNAGDFVAFNQASSSTSEGSTSGTADGQSTTLIGTTSIIDLNRSTTNLSAPITIEFSIEATYTEDSDFHDAGDDASDQFVITPSDGKLVIPANQAVGKIVITTIDDIRATGDKLVKLTITSTSNNEMNLGFPGPDANNRIHNFTIIDDDCPIDLSTWAGTYKVSSFCGAPGSTNDGFCLDQNGFYSPDDVSSIVTLTPDASDPVGIKAILSGGILTDDVNITFNTCPQTVSFSGGPYGLSFSVSGSQGTIVPVLQPEEFGVGVFNPEAFSFSLMTTLGNTGGGNFDAFEMVFVKEN